MLGIACNELRGHVVPFVLLAGVTLAPSAAGAITLTADQLDVTRNGSTLFDDTFRRSSVGEATYAH